MWDQDLIAWQTGVLLSVECLRHHNLENVPLHCQQSGDSMQIAMSFRQQQPAVRQGLLVTALDSTQGGHLGLPSDVH